MGALIFGLVLSVLLMGVASSFIATLLNKYRWIGWSALPSSSYVAIGMVSARRRTIATTGDGALRVTLPLKCSAIAAVSGQRDARPCVSVRFDVRSGETSPAF